MRPRKRTQRSRAGRFPAAEPLGCPRSSTWTAPLLPVAPPLEPATASQRRSLHRGTRVSVARGECCHLWRAPQRLPRLTRADQHGLPPLRLGLSRGAAVCPSVGTRPLGLRLRSAASVGTQCRLCRNFRHEPNGNSRFSGWSRLSRGTHMCQFVTRRVSGDMVTRLRAPGARHPAFPVPPRRLPASAGCAQRTCCCASTLPTRKLCVCLYLCDRRFWRSDEALMRRGHQFRPPPLRAYACAFAQPCRSSSTAGAVLRLSRDRVALVVSGLWLSSPLLRGRPHGAPPCRLSGEQCAMQPVR